MASHAPPGARPSAAAALLLCLLLGAALAPAPAVAAPVAQLEVEDEVAEPEEPIDPAPLDEAPPPGPPPVTATGAVLWDPADDVVLHGVAEDVPRPMASTTKIMTSLLAIEAGTIDDTVTVSARAAAIGEATLDLVAGQQIPMRSLVAGLLVRSGNDAAAALAEHVSGDEARFVAAMNARASELGLEATRFVNASGLTNDPGHHASPLDLARLAEHAMGYAAFAEYAGAARATVPGLAPMVNRNELLGVYPGADGVKTGYTRLAGLCLVASATRDGRTLYAVVLGSEDSFGDTAALLDYGFTAFRRAEPAAEAGAVVADYRWADAAAPLVTDAALGATVPVGASVTWRTVLSPALQRPAAEGAPAGTAQLLVDGELREEVPLRLGAAVAAPAAVAPAAAAGRAVSDALRAFARLHAVDRAA